MAAMIATARPSKRRLNDHQKVMQRCKDDLGFFPQTFIGDRLWRGQLNMKKSVRENRRTYCESGHDVGKTHGMAGIMLEFMLFPHIYADHPLPPNPKVRAILTAGTASQVHDVLWREVRSQFYRAAQRGVPLGPPDQMLATSWELTPSWTASALSVGDPNALQGKHADIVMVMVDEGEHRDIPWGAIDSLMSPANARLLVCYNPLKASGHCYEMAQKPDQVSVVHMSCLDHPNYKQRREVIPGAVSYEWVEEVRRREGEDSPYWQSRVLGQAPEGSYWQLITRKMLEKAENAEGIAVPEPRRLGLDVARGGGDKCAMGITDEWRTLRHVESWNGENLTMEDLMQTASRVKTACDTHGVSKVNGDVKVDVGGMGAGVADRLEQLGVSVDRVDFGAGPVGDWTSAVSRDVSFKNRKAELHWAVRVAVKSGSLRIPREFTEVWADLCAPTYEMTENEQIAIERKTVLRKRLGRSPDFGDMVCILMSNAGKKPELVSFA